MRNPVCRARVVGGSVAAASAPAINTICDIPFSDDLFNKAMNEASDEDKRQKDHDDYKDLIAAKDCTPDSNDPCLHHLREARRNQKAADLMKEFDIKYNLGDKHATNIAKHERLARRDMKRYKACLSAQRRK